MMRVQIHVVGLKSGRETERDQRERVRQERKNNELMHREDERERERVTKRERVTERERERE
jgi:hypothetical protein